MLAAVVVIVAALATLPASALASGTPEYFQQGKPVPAGSSIGFTWSGGSTFWQDVNGNQIGCKGSTTGEGEIVGPGEDRLTITYRECSSSGFFSCNSQGQPSGTIRTEPLKGRLYYGHEGGGKPRAVEDLSPVKGNAFAKLYCGPVLREWTGSLIGFWERTNLELNANTLVFRESGGHQSIKEYEVLAEFPGCERLQSTPDYLQMAGVEMGLETTFNTQFSNGVKDELQAPCDGV